MRKHGICQVPMGLSTIYMNIVGIYTLLHAGKGRNKSHLLPVQFKGKTLISVNDTIIIPVLDQPWVSNNAINVSFSGLYTN